MGKLDTRGVGHAVKQVGDGRHEYIVDIAAFGAAHMIMLLRVEIEAVSARRHRNAQDFALKGELIEVALHSRLTDGRMLGCNDSINAVRCGVVVQRAPPVKQSVAERCFLSA